MDQSKQRHTKQLTFDNLPKAPIQTATKTPKNITITQIVSTIREDELALKIAFKLFPSMAEFSKIQSDLLFDNQQVDSVSIRVLQGALATDESEYTSVLDMKGIPAGCHSVKVEMYELWDSGERLNQTSREAAVDYVPQTRQSRLVLVPTVKSVAGTDLSVVSESEKDIYREIDKTLRKEQLNKRDNW